MSDAPPPKSDRAPAPAANSEAGNGDRPRRRRRRRKPRKPGAEGNPAAPTAPSAAAPATPASQPPANPTPERSAAPAAAATPTVPTGRPPVRRNRPKPKAAVPSADAGTVRPPGGRSRRRRNKPAPPADATRPAGPPSVPTHAAAGVADTSPKRSNHRLGSKPPADDRPRPAANADAAPAKKKKKRKARTKDCVACYTPHVSIHRVKIDHRNQWRFICDICWADRCVDNPHYEYGGLWTSGRVMTPESELHAERQSKRSGRG